MEIIISCSNGLNKIQCCYYTGLLIVPYILIISYAWLGLIKQGSKDFITLGQQESKQLPNITVIIAAKDEEDCLPALINDLQEQVYPSDRHEIIIVDDKSTDSTSQIIKEADGITYMLSKGDGKKKAIACGLEHAKGELIITTDSDCRIGSRLGYVACFALCLHKECRPPDWTG